MPYRETSFEKRERLLLCVPFHSAVYQANMHPRIPTATSIAPSMLSKVIGDAKNGLHCHPKAGRRKHSSDSHSKPPRTRNPTSRTERPNSRTFLLPCLFRIHSAIPADIAMRLVASEIMNPKMKCSNMSSSEKMRRTKKWSMNRSAKRSKNGKITLLADTAVSMLLTQFFSLPDPLHARSLHRHSAVHAVKAQ
jgi:hypothetical protein